MFLHTAPYHPEQASTSIAYVALSRATRMETLQVVNFDPAKYVLLPVRSRSAR